MTQRNLFAGAVALALASPAWAGLVVTAEDGDGKKSVTYLEGKNMRMEHAATGDDKANVMVFDGAARRFYQVDPDAKTYRVITEDTGKELRAKYDAMLAQLPPEQRARAEAALARMKKEPPKQHEIKFEPLGGGEVVSGYPCQRYRVVRDGKADRDGCFIPWSARVATREDLAPFREMVQFSQGFTANMTGTSARGTGGWLAEEIERAPGFPALLERVDDHGKRTVEHRVLKLERRRVDAGLFAVPAGFTQLETFDAEPTRRARRGK